MGNEEELDAGTKARPGKEPKQQASRSTKIGDDIKGNTAPVQYINLGGIFAIIVSIIALMFAFTGYMKASSIEESQQRTEAVVIEAAMNAAAAAERANNSQLAAGLSREYAVTVASEVKAVFDQRGLSIESATGNHAPIPQSAYDAHDDYVTEESQ